jgi:hypothetical protein
MNEILGIPDDVIALFQTAELVWLGFGNDLEDAPFADHFHRNAGLESLIENVVYIRP